MYLCRTWLTVLYIAINTQVKRYSFLTLYIPSSSSLSFIMDRILMIWIFCCRLRLLVILVTVVIIYFLIITSNCKRIDESSFNKFFYKFLYFFLLSFRTFLTSNTILQIIRNITTNVSYPNNNKYQALFGWLVAGADLV